MAKRRKGQRQRNGVPLVDLFKQMRRNLPTPEQIEAMADKPFDGLTEDEKRALLGAALGWNSKATPEQTEAARHAVVKELVSFIPPSRFEDIIGTEAEVKYRTADEAKEK